MKACVFSFTQKGDCLGKKITAVLGADTPHFSSAKIKGRLKELTGKAFNSFDAVIYIGAVGIAVRAVAPHIADKASDPAVVVCDECGGYVIPILSGHIGGANTLALKIANYLGAVPVITTATDINGVWAVDNWAVQKGFKIHNTDAIKHISSAMLKGENIGLVSDIIMDDILPPNIKPGDTLLENGIVISPFIKKPFKKTLNIVPQCITIGAGSRKNADTFALVKLVDEVLAQNNISPFAIKAVATIDLKKNEPSVLELCRAFNTELICYNADELNMLEGSFSKSDFVKSVTGTDNVCERCAVRATDGGALICSKICGNGVTIAVAIEKKESK